MTLFSRNADGSYECDTHCPYRPTIVVVTPTKEGFVMRLRVHGTISDGPGIPVPTIAAAEALARRAFLHH